MALRPLYAPVLNRSIGFSPGITQEMIKEVMAFAKIPMELVSVDQTLPYETRAHISVGCDLPEKIQVPDHLYVWVL